MTFKFFIIIAAGLFISSCNSNYTYGKRRGYFRIDLPEKKYRVFDQPGYPYTFEYPVYANITKDSTFFGDKAGDWWINIDVPQLAGRIYISYKDINSQVYFDSLVEDAHKMAYTQHVQVSTGIDENLLHAPNGAGGIYYELAGNTATANQFFITDTFHHFLRGALYFDATANADSLSIVNDFLKKDMLHLVSTLKWR